MEFLEALKTEEFADGEMKLTELNGKAITVAHVGADYYAFDNACTHKQCSLSGGTLEGAEVVCPCHGGKFDVKTGQATALPAVSPVTTYPVKVENGSIYVQC